MSDVADLNVFPDSLSQLLVNLQVLLQPDLVIVTDLADSAQVAELEAYVGLFAG